MIKKLFHFTFCFTLLVLSAALFSCASTSSAGSNEAKSPLLTENELLPENLFWEEITPGVFHTYFKINKSNVIWNCVKIDLKTPGLSLDIKTSAKPFKLRNYARKSQVLVAVNTTPFTKNQGLSLLGITKINGTVISAPEEKYGAFCFNVSDGEIIPEIINSQTESCLAAWDNAAGAYFVILDNSQIIDIFKHNHRSRTGCGINYEHNQLYILTVTSPSSISDSSGLTYQECALIFKSLGCNKAIQFDGGHSTGLCINGNSISKPKFQRKIHAALGITVN